MTSDQTITVFGAYGHTGRFVVAELLNRGCTPILAGREAGKLEDLARAYPGLETRLASVDDPASLDGALDGAAAVINCAGPFMDTSVPVAEAAVRARIHYLDVTAEQQPALALFERYDEAAGRAGIAIAPAMAFFGGLADLLATAAVGDWAHVDEIRLAVALDSWAPTAGTRITGKRNTAPRLVVSNSELVGLAAPPPTMIWDFPAPFGRQPVVGLALAEIITMSRHLRAAEIHPYMNLRPLDDLRDPMTPAPTASDESGRSDQVFMMDVIARHGGDIRRATAVGRDIYAITAPIVVEAAMRITGDNTAKAGVFAAGELFDARDFLSSLRAAGLAVEFNAPVANTI